MPNLVSIFTEFTNLVTRNTVHNCLVSFPQNAEDKLVSNSCRCSQLLFKKSDESTAFKEFQPDPEFRRVVFSSAEYSKSKSQNKEAQQEENGTKLGKFNSSGSVNSRLLTLFTAVQ